MDEKSSTDKIFLHDLRVETVVGIWDWERKIRQTVSIDLEMGTDIRRAAASDAIDDTLNYKQVAKRVQQFVADSEFRLVETMAENVARIVLDEFDTPWIEVRINKPGAIRGARLRLIRFDPGMNAQSVIASGRLQPIDEFEAKGLPHSSVDRGEIDESLHHRLLIILKARQERERIQGRDRKAVFGISRLRNFEAEVVMALAQRLPVEFIHPPTLSGLRRSTGSA